MLFHRRLLKFSVLAALILVSGLSIRCFADCLACWELKGVSLRLRDGSVMQGYMPWNEAWLPDVCREKKLPEVLFEPGAEIGSIQIYADLRTIDFPLRNALVALVPAAAVPVQEILELHLKPGPHDGYSAAGDIPVVSRRIADLLRTKPVASCQADAGLADIYWVSYNKGITARQLDCLCKEPWISLIDNGKNLEVNNVVKLIFPYD